MNFDPNDSGRVPGFRSSILQRYHPYLRLRPSVREVLMAKASDGPHSEGHPTPRHEQSNSELENLERALCSAQENAENIQRKRRLSSSSLIIDLALVVMRKKNCHGRCN